MPFASEETTRNRFSELFDRALATHETIYLCSVPGMREKIMKGLATPLEDCLEA